MEKTKRKRHVNHFSLSFHFHVCGSQIPSKNKIKRPIFSPRALIIIKTKRPLDPKCSRYHSRENLFDGNRLGQVTWEINVETLSNCEPVGHKLKRNNVEETLEAVDCLWNLDLLGLSTAELFVIRVADDDWLTAAGNNYKNVSKAQMLGMRNGIPC